MLTGCEEEIPIVSSEPDPVAAEQFINTHSFTDYATTKGLTPVKFEFTGYASKLIAAGAVPMHDCYVVASEPTNEKKGSAAEIVGIPLVQDGEFSHLALFAVTDSGAEHKAGADLDYHSGYGYVKMLLDHKYRDMSSEPYALTDLALEVDIESKDKTCDVVIVTTYYWIYARSTNYTYPPRFDGMTSEALITCWTEDRLNNNGRIFPILGGGGGTSPTNPTYSITFDPSSEPDELDDVPPDSYLDCSVWNFAETSGGRDITVLDNALMRFYTAPPDPSGIRPIREIPYHIYINMDEGYNRTNTIEFKRCMSSTITRAVEKVSGFYDHASNYAPVVLSDRYLLSQLEHTLSENLGQCSTAISADLDVRVVQGFWQQPDVSYRSVATYSTYFGNMLNCLW